jgi:hypothetical protein
MENSRAIDATLFFSACHVDLRGSMIRLHASHAAIIVRVEVEKSVIEDDLVRRALTENQPAVTEFRTVC